MIMDGYGCKCWWNFWLVLVSVCIVIALRSVLIGQETFVMFEKRGQHVK